MKAQLVNNIVRGEVTDLLTGMPIEGVHVDVEGEEELGVVTTADG